MGIDYKKYDDLPEADYRLPRSNMFSFLPQDSRIILDVGCGEGAIAELIKQQRDAEVCGIEMFTQAAEMARIKLDRKFVGNIEQADLTYRKSILTVLFLMIYWNTCITLGMF